MNGRGKNDGGVDLPAVFRFNGAYAGHARARCEIGYSKKRRSLVMGSQRIIFSIEGPKENNSHLELSVFAEKIGHFLALLNENARESSEEGVEFHITHLSHSSPATIECETVTREIGNAGVKECIATNAFEALDKNLNYIKEGNTNKLSPPVLSTMERLSKFNPTKVARAELQLVRGDGRGKTVYRLDDRFKEQLSNARYKEERVISTIDGKLEQINIHNRANTFRIYPSLPPASHISCEFPQELLEKVQSSLGYFVSVSGECLYRPDAVFPYKIIVQEMAVLPPAEELPHMKDLFGLASGCTNGKSSEQFVREMRDKWSRDA